jgi:energy-coupling factor transport system permease protein
MIADLVLLRRRRSARRGGIDAVLLRRLPHDSCMHRIGAGTKLICLTALTVAIGLNTSWAQLISVATIVVLAVTAARVPWRAVPRLPIWFWVMILIGFGLAAAGGGADRFLRLIGFSLLFIVLSMVIAWTIDLGDLAPTLRRVGSPLHRLGLPVDEWAITAALAVRCLPLMLDECRTVLAARRQRQISRRDPAQVAWAIIDVITASMAAAIRRASDLGEVIALRGGPTMPARPANRLHSRDLAALVLVAAATAIPSIVA